MKKSINNKLHMYRAVIKTLEIHQNVWSGVTEFENAYNGFTAKYVELVGLGNQRKTILDGVSTEQKSAKRAAVSSVLNIAKILKSYAIKNELFALVETADVSKTELYRSRLANRLELMAVVLEHAELHINDLAGFGLDPGELADAQTAFQAYLVISTEYRNAIILRRQLTRAIDRKVKEIDAILKNELDLMIPIVSSTNVTFFESYTDARKLIDYKGGSSSSENESPGSTTMPNAA